jgi:hypothetical protein
VKDKPSIVQVTDAYLSYAENRWSADYLMELIRTKPDEAWQILTRVIESVSEHSIYYVAAGPLEEFVVAHGGGYLEIISDYARTSPRMQRALGGVWGDSRMPRKVWKQIQKLAGKA